MIMKILVAVDGPEGSSKALKEAVSLAQKYQAAVTLICVVETELRGWLLPLGLRKDFKDKALEEGAAVLSRFQRVANRGNVPVETLLAQGHPVEQIVRAAEKGKFDMVVLGKRGMSLTRKILIGSVAEKVCRLAKCSVLVVK